MALTISSARATLGLSATATLSAHNTSGDITLGGSNRTIRLTQATHGYSLLAVFAGSGDALVLALSNNDTTGSTAWVAGVAQVETATAAGTITTAGNATAIVTSAGMSGSPLTVTFAVALSDTAAQWAAKARTALAANATIAERFTVSGSSTGIILTRNPTATFTVPGGTLPIYAGPDATLNIALADATSAGITEAATSTGTTAGTASDGVKVYDGDGNDLEGSAISFPAIFGFSLFVTGNTGITMLGDVDDITLISGDETYTRASPTGVGLNDVQTFSATGPCALSITVIGGTDI